jgi:hypothetical protein
MAILASAVVVLALFVIGLVRQGAPSAGPPGDLLLEQMLSHQLALANADSLDRRVEVLAQMAGTLDGHARSLALVAEVSDLESLARLFVDVLGQKGLSGKAELVPPLNRKPLLEPIAADLMRMATAHEELAQRVPPNRTAAFRQMAQAAREARDVIRKKLREEDVAGRSPDRGIGQGGKS